MNGVPPGHAVMTVYGADLEFEKPVDVPADQDVTLDIAFPAGARLSGRVTQGGKPAAHKNVWMRPVEHKADTLYSVSTAEDGQYEIEGLPPGDYDYLTEIGLAAEQGGSRGGLDKSAPSHKIAPYHVPGGLHMKRNRRTLLKAALGASAAWPGPVVLLTGDLAFLHDLGGLAAARDAGSLAIVLIENGGGGIFSFLPIAEHGEAVAFERLFRTPHRLPLQRAAELFGVGWERIGSWEHFRAALKASLATPARRGARARPRSAQPETAPSKRAATASQLTTFHQACR